MFGQFVLEPVVLAIIVAGFVSLILNYFPELRVWFAGLADRTKSFVMIGVLALVSLAVWGAGCLNLLSTNIVCSKNGLVELVKIFGATLLANQTTYLLSPQASDVKLAKNIRDVVAKEVAPATPAIKAEAASISENK